MFLSGERITRTQQDRLRCVVSVFERVEEVSLCFYHVASDGYALVVAQPEIIFRLGTADFGSLLPYAESLFLALFDADAVKLVAGEQEHCPGVKFVCRFFNVFKPLSEVFFAAGGGT